MSEGRVECKRCDEGCKDCFLHIMRMSVIVSKCGHDSESAHFLEIRQRPTPVEIASRSARRGESSEPALARHGRDPVLRRILRVPSARNRRPPEPSSFFFSSIRDERSAIFCSLSNNERVVEVVKRERPEEICGRLGRHAQPISVAAVQPVAGTCRDKHRGTPTMRFPACSATCPRRPNRLRRTTTRVHRAGPNIRAGSSAFRSSAWSQSRAGRDTSLLQSGDRRCWLWPSPRRRARPLEHLRSAARRA